MKCLKHVSCQSLYVRSIMLETNSIIAHQSPQCLYLFQMFTLITLHLQSLYKLLIFCSLKDLKNHSDWDNHEHFLSPLLLSQFCMWLYTQSNS